MSAVAKTIVPSLAVGSPCNAHKIPNKALYADVNLSAGDACYINADGGVNLCSGAAANAAALCDGFCLANVVAGQPVTLYEGVEIAYGPSTLTPGTRLYISGTVPGGLDTAASTGGTTPVAKVVYNNTATGTPHSVIKIRSQY